MVEKFNKGNASKKKDIVDFYLKNTRFVNSWDLVDLSAHNILGAYLHSKSKSIIYKLAKSQNLWERRIAIISTYSFIKNNEFQFTLKIAAHLINDKHDLINKAVGWMLREVGKRDSKTELKFLDQFAHTMNRTTLRYAIEKFPETKRRHYLTIKGK